VPDHDWPTVEPSLPTPLTTCVMNLTSVSLTQRRHLVTTLTLAATVTTTKVSVNSSWRRSHLLSRCVDEVWQRTELQVCDEVVVSAYWEDVMVYHGAGLLLLQVGVVMMMESSLVSNTQTQTFYTQPSGTFHSHITSWLVGCVRFNVPLDTF